MYKKPLNFIIFIIAFLFISGCVNLAGERALFSDWGEQNKRQNQMLGERVYDKDSGLVFTAFITGLANMGFVVRNMERQSGYILAEGPLPISIEEEAKIGKSMSDELNSVSNRGWKATPGNCKIGVTVTILPLGKKQTKAKVHIAMAELRSQAAIQYSQLYPPIIDAAYKAIWPAIDKQIFLDQNLDKTTP